MASGGSLPRSVTQAEAVNAREMMLDQLIASSCQGARRLREFVHDPLQSELELEGLSPPARALLHNIAALYQISSTSKGPKKNRVMVLTKKEKSPSGDIKFSEQLCHEGYIGLRGAWIEVAAAKRSDQVPESMKQLRARRDGLTHHITLFSSKEVALLKKKIKGNTLISTLSKELANDWVDVGQGYLQLDGKEAYYRVVTWPSGNQLRRRYGFGEATFHITQGFDPSDIHDVPKDTSTLIHQASE